VLAGGEGAGRCGQQCVEVQPLAAEGIQGGVQVRLNTNSNSNLFLKLANLADAGAYEHDAVSSDVRLVKPMLVTHIQRCVGCSAARSRPCDSLPAGQGRDVRLKNCVCFLQSGEGCTVLRPRAVPHPQRRPEAHQVQLESELIQSDTLHRMYIAVHLLREG
jgi:hypothetical protein